MLVALGGNFALATPDLPFTFEALRSCELTVQVSTELNWSHVVHGTRALILTCLGRTEKDGQANGEQGVTVEDAMSMVHISLGMKDPVSPHLRSECAILTGLARATLPESKTPWEGYVEDYDRIRDTWRRCSTASKTSTSGHATHTASASANWPETACSRPPLGERSSPLLNSLTTWTLARGGSC